jgi:hypothetical protein
MLENQVEGYEITCYLPPFSRKMLELRNYIEPNYFITQRALSITGPYEDNNPFPDHDMLLKVSEKQMIIQIPRVLSHHVITPTGLTNTTTEAEKQKATENALRKALQRKIA